MRRIIAMMLLAVVSSSAMADGLKEYDFGLAAWTALWSVGLSFILAYSLTSRYTQSTPKTAHGQGMKWGAWSFLACTVVNLPRFLTTFEVDALAKLFIGIIFFPVVGYGLGYVYFKFRNRNVIPEAAPLSSGQRSVPVAPVATQTVVAIQTPPVTKHIMNNPPPVNVMPTIAVEYSQQPMQEIEDWLYEQIAQEIETNAVDKGLWTKAYAQPAVMTSRPACSTSRPDLIG